MANKIKPGAASETVFIKLISLYGRLAPSIILADSVVKNNWATQDTIHILRSSMFVRNCTMEDNYAHEVTHGFTMVESEVYLQSTRISNSEEMLEKLRQW